MDILFACLAMLAIMTAILLYRSGKKAASVPASTPSIEIKDTQKHLEDLRSEDDEIVAARFRAMVSKPSAHPMEEPFRKAITLLAREWGMSVRIDHNVYDFSSHDKHSVHVTFECETRKIPK